MKAAGAAAFIAFLAVSGCARQDATEDVTALLRAQGFAYLDEPKVTISPLCSVRVGPTRYDFYWYNWQQQTAPGALHAAHRLIQIRDGKTYDGHYGSLQPEDRPTCRPDSRELVFTTDAYAMQTPGSPPQFTIQVGEGGLPQRILVNGEFYTRTR